MWVAENKRLVDHYEDITQLGLPAVVVDPDGSREYEGYELLLLLWETEEWRDSFGAKPVACVFAVGCEKDGQFVPITQAKNADIALLRVERKTDTRELEKAILAAVAEEGVVQLDDILRKTHAEEQEVQDKLNELVRIGKLRKFKAGGEVFYEEGGA